jgi:hypothetical protein
MTIRDKYLKTIDEISKACEQQNLQSDEVDFLLGYLYQRLDIIVEKHEVKLWPLYKALQLAIWCTEQEIKTLNYRDNEDLLPDWISLRDKISQATKSFLLEVNYEGEESKGTKEDDLQGCVKKE